MRQQEMKGRSYPAVLLLLVVLYFPALASSQWAQDKFFEEVFLSIPTVDSASGHLTALASQSHVAGTVLDYNTAVYVRGKV